jgi:hypothetical protein
MFQYPYTKTDWEPHPGPFFHVKAPYRTYTLYMHALSEARKCKASNTALGPI